MQYQVPQFIEVEDKIVGPLTFKQALYLFGGGGACFLFYKLLPFYVAILLIAPIAALALALTFYKINERPFADILEAGFYYILSNRLFLWSHDYHQDEKKAIQQKEYDAEQAKTKKPIVRVSKISEGKLRDLAWSLDINENVKDNTQ